MVGNVHEEAVEHGENPVLSRQVDKYRERLRNSRSGRAVEGAGDTLSSPTEVEAAEASKEDAVAPEAEGRGG